MQTNEKELNAILFDQLTLIERGLNNGEESARKEIEILKKEINRKLYQNPPLEKTE